MWFGRGWNDAQLPGGTVSPDYHLRIRRAAPAPAIDAPAPADCQHCEELRKQLEATLRRVESESVCRRIAETACVSAEKACAHHQSEADKLRAELDKDRAAHEATSAQSMEAHALLGMKENECERLRTELKAARCDLDRARHFLSNAEKACAEWHERADRMEAQRDEAKADAAALLRVVRLMATGKESKP